MKSEVNIYFQYSVISLYYQYLDILRYEWFLVKTTKPWTWTIVYFFNGVLISRKYINQNIAKQTLIIVLRTEFLEYKWYIVQSYCYYYSIKGQKFLYDLYAIRLCNFWYVDPNNHISFYGFHNDHPSLHKTCILRKSASIINMVVWPYFESITVA